MNKEKGFVGITVTMVVLFLLALLICGIRFSQIGEGTHTGFVTAVDQRGYIFRNYDVYFKTDNSSSQEDTYCIHRDNMELVERAKELNEKRELVTIKYKGVRGFGFGLCGFTEIKSID